MLSHLLSRPLSSSMSYSNKLAIESICYLVLICADVNSHILHPVMSSNNIVKDGIMYKRGDYRQVWRIRFFILRRDPPRLEYYARPGRPLRGSLRIGSQTIVMRLPANKHGKESFSVRYGDKMYLLACEGEGVVSLWISAIMSLLEPAASSSLAARVSSPTIANSGVFDYEDIITKVKDLPTSNVHIDHYDDVYPRLLFAFTTSTMMGKEHREAGWEFLCPLSSESVRLYRRTRICGDQRYHVFKGSTIVYASPKLVASILRDTRMISRWSTQSAARLEARHYPYGRGCDLPEFVDHVLVTSDGQDSNLIRYSFQGMISEDKAVNGVVAVDVDYKNSFSFLVEYIEGESNMCIVRYIVEVEQQPQGWFYTIDDSPRILSTLRHRLQGLKSFSEHVSTGAETAILGSAGYNLDSPSIIDRPSEFDRTEEKSLQEDRLEFDSRFEFGFPNFVRSSDGGMRYTDDQLISDQRGVAKYLIKTVGSNLLKGKSLLDLSLPVHIFEPQTFLQRLANCWVYAPILLNKAYAATEKLERLKYCVCFAMSGQHRNLEQRKPFNPRLGETFQAHFSDGTSVFLEQISHNPPVSYFNLIGDGFLYHGHQEQVASLGLNKAVGHQFGPNHIDFSDGDRVTWEYSPVNIDGIIWGERNAYVVDSYIVRYPSAQLECCVRFGKQYSGGWSYRSGDALDSIVYLCHLYTS